MCHACDRYDWCHACSSGQACLLCQQREFVSSKPRVARPTRGRVVVFDTTTRSRAMRVSCHHCGLCLGWHDPEAPENQESAKGRGSCPGGRGRMSSFAPWSIDFTSANASETSLHDFQARSTAPQSQACRLNQQREFFPGNRIIQRISVRTTSRQKN